MSNNTNPFEDEDFQLYYEEDDCMNDDEREENVESETIEKDLEATETKDEEEKEDEEEKKDNSNSSEHDGKYFVVQKGMDCCDKGAKFPNFKVTSHQKHYWNNDKGEADYLSVTEDDLNFNPPAMPFGTCSLKNGNPCSFAPAGKWTKTYEKVKIMDKKPLTELSELMCAVGGKITVMKHGQQSEAVKNNVNNADSWEQHAYNPIMDFEEFQEEINGNDTFEVE